MQIVTTDSVDGAKIHRGEMLYACAISGANLLRDMREAITNTIGGEMTRYERLLDRTIARALSTLSDRAKKKGYDGVVGVRISHPVIVHGAMEVVVSGTGFRFDTPSP